MCWSDSEAGPTGRGVPCAEKCVRIWRSLLRRNNWIAAGPVGDSVKEDLVFMCRSQVYHKVPVSYLDKSGLKAIGTRWIYKNMGGAANPFVRARLVAQETKSKRVDAGGREQHVCSYIPPESLKVMPSRCMTGKRRTPAAAKVLGFYDISRAHFHSPARRTIVIKLPREDDECTSGYAVLDKAMYGTKDAAQCFDVASENAMTAMGYDTGKFSPCLCHSSAAARSVFRHGDNFVVSGTRTQQEELEEQATKHRHALCHTGTVHSTWRRHRGQEGY